VGQPRLARLSVAFFGPHRTNAMRHSAPVPRRSSRVAIADRVLEAMVRRPVAVGAANHPFL